MRKTPLAILILAMPLAGFAQETSLSLENAIKFALEKNPSVQASGLEVSRQQQLNKTSVDIPKTDVSLMYGQYNSIQKNDNNITISQSIPFPTVFGSQSSLNKALVNSAMLKESVTKNELSFQVKQVFNQLVYLKERQHTLLQHDSLLTDLARAATVQYKTGEGTLLARTSADTQLMEIKNLIARNDADIRIALNHLQLLCQSKQITDVVGDQETLVSFNTVDSSSIDQNPSLALITNNIEVSRRMKKLEVSRTLPDLRIGYFNQTLIGTQNINGTDQYFGSSKRFQGFQAGIGIPLWFGPHTARIKAANIETQVAEKQKESFQLAITHQYNQAIEELMKNKNSLSYYRDSALETANLLTSQSRKAFKSGELDYTTLLLNLRQSLAIREGYLLALQQYNQSIITIQFLNGNK
ncbi:MAG: TolC family protein [Chryseolinea sp.]